MKNSFLPICLAILLGSCQVIPISQPTITPVSPANIPTLTSTELPTLGSAESLRLTLSMLQNAGYHSSDWGDFQLTDGIYYRTPPNPGESPDAYSTQLFQSTFGDLNADGFQDAAVILQTHNGGNGDTKELAAMLDQSGQAYNISTVYIGSMIALEALQIQSGVIVLNLRVQGPNDALCCPSQPVTWQFRLENNQLIQLP